MKALFADLSEVTQTAARAQPCFAVTPSAFGWPTSSRRARCILLGLELPGTMPGLWNAGSGPQRRRRTHSLGSRVDRSDAASLTA
jgi:hypothetical protein